MDNLTKIIQVNLKHVKGASDVRLAGDLPQGWPWCRNHGVWNEKIMGLGKSSKVLYENTHDQRSL